MALAIKLDLQIDQMDAVTAFLQGDLEEVIYMEQPDEYNDGTGRVCKLNRSIYGLKQSGRQWNKKLDEKLREFGLEKSKLDPSIYFTHEESLILAIYVDDILIFWKNEESKNKLKTSLCNAFKMQNLGQPNNCIGLRITADHKNGKIWLDQKQYIVNVLQKFNMSDCKSVSSPSDPYQKLSINMVQNKENEEDFRSKIPYQEAVGSLLYLAQGTRPDIAFAVNDVSRFNNNFGKPHWAAVKRIMRYLKGTIDTTLCYTKKGNMHLQGFVDSDWASDIDKRRSCTGYIFTLAGGAISWNSKRQPTVALSSTEAEYMALSTATQEGMWLKQLSNEMDPTSSEEHLEIKIDNQGAINLANCDAFRARSKHIDIRHHYVREKIQDGVIKLVYTPTEKMAADNLTKAVSGAKIKNCNKIIGLCEH